MKAEKQFPGQGYEVYPDKICGCFVDRKFNINRVNNSTEFRIGILLLRVTRISVRFTFFLYF